MSKFVPLVFNTLYTKTFIILLNAIVNYLDELLWDVYGAVACDRVQ